LKGDTGDTGPQGPAGATGATGPQGPAGADGASTWEAISGKPTTFAPSAHTHTVSAITDFPTIPAAQVNSDWNATSGLAQILNKPDLANLPNQPVNDTSSPFFEDLFIAGTYYAGTSVELNATGLLLESTGIGGLNDIQRRNRIMRDGQDLYFGNAAGSSWNKLAFASLNNSFTAGQTITAAANTSALTASYSVTGANTTPLLDLSGTWNITGAANGIRLNITDTASASTSRLLDLQVGGTSRFTVLKSGQFSTPSDLYTNSVALTAGVRIALNSTLGFTLSSNPAVNPDTILARDAANTLALRNGGTAGTPVPQTFRLYNYTDAGLTNFERGFMRWNSNVLEIGTEAGGTGTANRSVRLLIGTQSSGVVFSAAGSGVDINARSFTTGANMTLVGSNISGLATCNYTSASTDPTTTTITNGNWQVHRNTTSGTVRLWANNNGTMVSVALS
jgi:hypothetical protein